MSTSIPLEVIDCILDHVDNASLVQLCGTTRNFRTAALPRLIRQFLSGIHIRLWIEQHGLIGHRPLDFVWEAISDVNNRLVFIPSKRSQETMCSFSTYDKDTCSPSPSPMIDGLTMVLPDTKTMKRKIESTAYQKDERISIALMTNEYTKKEYHATAKHPSWSLHYTTWIDPNDNKQVLCPQSFECDWSLPLNMSLKSSSSSSSS